MIPNDALLFDRGEPRGHFDFSQVLFQEDDGNFHNEFMMAEAWEESLQS